MECCIGDNNHREGEEGIAEPGCVLVHAWLVSYVVVVLLLLPLMVVNL